MTVRTTWYAKGQTIVAKAFIGDRLAHRAEHEFPRAGTLALFKLVIGCMSREVAENAR